MKFSPNCTRTVMLVGLTLAFSVSGISLTSGEETSQVASLNRILNKVLPPELPAQAAKLVSQAPAKEQKSVAIAVVRIAVQRNPAAAPFIVSGVARAVPAVAAVSAAAAAVLEPKQAGAIAKAATAAAPSQAGEIVSAICKELPASYPGVAIGASEAAPAASEEILAAVSRAMPYLKPFVDQANKASRSAGGYASVAGVIQTTATLAHDSAPSPRTSLASALVTL